MTNKITDKLPKTIRVLIADDDPTVCYTLENYLQSLGHETVIAGNGAEAVKELERSFFDVVITDIFMPEIDGFGLISYVSENVPDTGVIVVTGGASNVTYVDVIEAGAIDYLVKPFTLDEIKAKINRAIRECSLIKKLKRELKIKEEVEKELELRVQEKTFELKALFNGAQAILKNCDFYPAMYEIFCHCAEIIGSRSGYVALRNENAPLHNVLYMERDCSASDEDSVQTLPICDVQSQVYKLGEIAYDNDHPNCSCLAPYLSEKPSIATTLVVPLSTSGLTVGLMGLINKQQGFNKDDVRVANAFGELAAIALENSRNIDSLKKGEAFIRSVVETAIDAIITIDDQGKVSTWNKAAEKVFGFTKDEIVGSSIKKIIPEHLQAQHDEGIRRIAACGKTKITGSTHEAVGLRKDGAHVPIELSLASFCIGKRTQFTGIVRDITERKRAEDSLRESEEKFRLIFENSPLGIAHFDKRGVLATCNDNLCRMFGSTKERLTGFDTLKHVKDERMHSAISAALHGEMGEYEGEYVSVTGERSTPMRAKLGPILTRNGAVVGAIGIFEDITEYKKAEEEKSLLKSKLQQAYKMEAIGTLAGGIAHDFNNLLGTILGYTDMAKSDIDPESPIFRYLDKALRAGYKAKDLVKQILAFSRQTEAERIPFRPAPIVKEAVKLLASTIPTTIEIKQNIDPKAGVILADPTQFHQIIMNLCTNSFHAMEQKGGVLEVTLRNSELPADYLSHETAKVNRVDTYVELTVRDTGQGINPDLKHKIFDPYFTTKEMGKGTGMGLAIVHGIVKSYGGVIRSESELGKGSGFHIYLPIVAEKPVVVEEKTPNDIIGGKERILFVDDDKLMAEIGQDMLEKLGYSVRAMSTSIRALELFESQPDNFDLVITDQTMPQMTGADLARRILQIRPGFPVILCTGYSSIISENDAKAIGIKEFALKPLVKNDLGRLIRKVLDEA